MSLPWLHHGRAWRLGGAVASVLLFLAGLVWTLVREEVSHRAGDLLGRKKEATLPALSGPDTGVRPTPHAPAAPAPAPLFRPAEPPRALSPRPLSLEGLWVPSGWMGDGETPGALAYRLCEEGAHSPPTCEEWSYDPARGSLGWAAVAYQCPENNWGSRKGQDLSRRGFTRLTFFARGKEGGERVLFKSGGHTHPGAPFPASYACSLGTITLTKTWREYSISLEGEDLSNVPAALVCVVSTQLCPHGCVFYLDDIAFRGPED
jgi:hypothetical protein